MKSSIKIIDENGREFTIEERKKYRVENFIFSDDAKYGTNYMGAFVEEVKSDGFRLILTFHADYTEKELKATR